LNEVNDIRRKSTFVNPETDEVEQVEDILNEVPASPEDV